MAQLATTKMSSRGQVVIPEEIRHQLHLEPGQQFVVIVENNVIILKAIAPPPTMTEFSELIAKAKKQGLQKKMSK